LFYFFYLLLTFKKPLLGEEFEKDEDKGEDGILVGF
jgi:hypothetical protein